MRDRARYLLAVTIVATALCADRAMAAMPDARPQLGQLVGQFAEKLVARLTTSFSQSVPSVRMFAQRQMVASAVSSRPWITRQLAVRPILLCPCQFRLPPPLV